MTMPHCATRRHGFTLLEIITVMIILAVLSAVVASRLTDQTLDIAAELEAVKSHLRYAQSRAMADSTDWYVQFASDSYTVYNGDGNAIVPPGAQSQAVPLAYHTATAGTVVLFDSLGRPFTDAAGTTAQSGVRTVLSSAGAGALTVMPETGYIP